MDRANRLSSPREFRRVVDSGARGETASVTCFALVTGAQAPPRVGITVTRRLGGAVVRNRARRRLREAIRPCLARLEPGTEVVVRAKTGAISKSFQELAGDVSSAMARAGVPC